MLSDGGHFLAARRRRPAAFWRGLHLFAKDGTLDAEPADALRDMLAELPVRRRVGTPCRTIKFAAAINQDAEAPTSKKHCGAGGNRTLKSRWKFFKFSSLKSRSRWPPPLWRSGLATAACTRRKVTSKRSLATHLIRHELL